MNHTLYVFIHTLDVITQVSVHFIPVVQTYITELEFKQLIIP